jgi:hypothetical protein
MSYAGSNATTPGACFRDSNRPAHSVLVFTPEFGAPMDLRNLLRIIEIAADKACVEHVGVHTLRRSAAVA